MRKILLPYKKYRDVSIHSDVVMAGNTKFMKDLFTYIPGIIPLEISEEDIAERRVKSLMLNALREHQPDLVISNYPEANYSLLPLRQGIPTITIIHEYLMGDIRFHSFVRYIQDIKKLGGKVYFVSELQKQFFDKKTNQILGHSLGDFSGYLNPAFCVGDEMPAKDIVYHATTVGRFDSYKDPFWLHSKLDSTDTSSDIVSCVSTGKLTVLKNNEFAQKYVEKHSDKWQYPRVTFFGLPHSESMSLIAQSGCFVSTMHFESFGITALEALARGIPLVLCAKDNVHASESIAADKSHYRLINRKTTTGEDLVELIRELNTISYEDRVAISEATKEKHSLVKWKDSIEAAISDCLGSNTVYKPPSVLNWM